MTIACPNCEHEVDPNDDSLVWHPPKDAARSLGAIECPSCQTVSDFADFKLLTGVRERPADSD